MSGIYNCVLDEPTRPTVVDGSIQCLVGLTEAVITLNWSPPQNHDRTNIDYYELTLIGDADTKTTTIVYDVGADSQQSFTHTLVVSAGRNYITANITAVDVCGQRSEPSHFALTTTSTNIVSECNTSTFLSPANFIILASVLNSMTLLMIISGGDGDYTMQLH